MSKREDGTRRDSVEERRVFRTARIEFVEIGRVTGIDAAAAELLREADIAAPHPIQFSDWSEIGLEALMLARPPIVVGNADGHATLGWLANAEVLLAAQQHWPPTKRIAVIVLAHQVSPRTRRLAAGGGLFASCSPSLERPMTPGALYRVWQTLIKLDLNPLASILKMNLVRVSGCDPRKLPSVRASRDEQEHSA